MPTPDFTKMVPGFDFLQSLLKGAGSGLPGMSQWIAPTLDADEVDRRIKELRTVQFWLEQNAKMLGATIQALEVQRMTLATLQTLNLPMADLKDSLKLNPAAFMPTPAPAPAPAAAAAPEPAPPPTEPEAPAAAPAAKPAVDPMQWWGALTRQFTELAANAMKDNPVEAATQLAEAAFKQAVAPMAEAMRSPPAAAGKAGAVKKATAAKTARKTGTTRR
ncbi:PhaM family polyhydroxyalkanoate granule multifunctional regulatory protein [Pseudorhodoferax sp.]|uniref:PhaM family polyhydroxyalkanoate granule multifunctional regulatory protein n=1 Tax=Pseudorhodoferax sp. TaxID=1993553 RepID=UPI002DD69E12|nr:PhaM family polyhydroxyalkanoate granule multifunctional regulatory protein [Pseudorhodoferax sp.]